MADDIAMDTTYTVPLDGDGTVVRREWTDADDEPVRAWKGALPDGTEIFVELDAEGMTAAIRPTQYAMWSVRATLDVLG